MNEQMQHRIARAKRMDRVMTGVFIGVGGFFILLLFAFVGYIVINGVSSYFPGVFSFNSSGIGNQLFNTIYMLVLSLAISALIGIPAGIYMAEYAGKNRWTTFCGCASNPFPRCHPS